jgi:hypothetical protein
MRYIKNFALFESKTHNLPLPKSEAELDKLRASDGFQRLKNQKFDRWYIFGGKKITEPELSIMRNGGVEIFLRPYNFKVSPTGNFYYGGLKVGPRHDTNLDTWDKLFDYVYLYHLANGRKRIAPSGDLENFVFHGVMTNSLYNKIANTENIETILDLARKYSGDAADKAIDVAKGKLSAFISDPSRVLETPVYKFFNQVFDFKPEIKNHHIEISTGEKSQFRILQDSGIEQPFWLKDPKFRMYFPGFITASSNLVKVKTMKGLDNAFLKEIKRLGDYSSSNPLDIISIDLLKRFIDQYEQGEQIPSLPDLETIIKNSFLDWNGTNKKYVKSLISLANSELTNKDKVIEEIAPKTMDILNGLKKEDLINYGEIMKEIGDIPLIKNSISDFYSSQEDIIKGTSVLRRFGI